MATDLSAYLDTVNHRRPARILHHFGCTPDLHERLEAHVGGEGDYGRHYGCLRSRGWAPAQAGGLATAGLLALLSGPGTATGQLDQRHRRVWQATKRVRPGIKTHHHSDGNLLEIVQDLVDAGLDILNPLQPECMGVDEVHREVWPRRRADRLAHARPGAGSPDRQHRGDGGGLPGVRHLRRPTPATARSRRPSGRWFPASGHAAGGDS